MLTNRWTIAFRDVLEFARVVGDHNAVHRDPEFATKTRFKSPIAHGMTAIVMLNHLLPPRLTIREFEIRFSRPIYPGDSISAQLEISNE